MTESKYLTQNLEDGSVHISDEVISTVAALAAEEVDGVYSLTSGFGTDLKEKITRKNIEKGVTLEVVDGQIRLSCNVVVLFGYTILDVARKVQERVAATVESCTGLHVDVVNVRIVGVAVSKKANADA